MNHKSTAEKAKLAGFKSLSALAERWGVTTQTLRNWDASGHAFFDDALAGAQLRELATSDKKRQIVTCTARMNGSISMIVEN